MPLPPHAPSLLHQVPSLLHQVPAFGDLKLELSSDRIFLSGGSFLLDKPLPASIDDATASAKFSTKKATLTIKAAVLA